MAGCSAPAAAARALAVNAPAYSSAPDAAIPPPVDSAAVASEYRGGSGTPLLLLHGITATFRVWQPVLPVLEEHHEVFAPTLAGHYGAVGFDPGLEPSAGAFVDRLEARLDELRMDRPHVVGNSLGGWLSLELARRGRARSVVAFSPAAAWRSRLDLARIILLVRGGNAAAGAAGSLRGLLARPRSRRALLRTAIEHGERVSPAVAVTMLEEAADCSVLGEFLRVVWRDGGLSGTVQAPSCPIRVAWPEHDRTIPFAHYGVPLLDALPTAELVRLPDVGHVPMYDDPRLVAQTILELTDSVDAAAPAG